MKHAQLVPGLEFRLERLDRGPEQIEVLWHVLLEALPGHSVQAVVPE